ncbi:MAG: bacteriocin [Lachnospiraceae bacterium]|nr:bacteriocin [Lachnospiraceae bacterium]
MADMKKINDDELDQVSGGYIFNAAGVEGTPDFPWEVLNNNTGLPMASFKTRDEAVRYAQSFKSSDTRDAQEIYLNTVLSIRAGILLQ